MKTSSRIASSPALASFHRQCASSLLSSEIEHAAREIGTSRHLCANAIRYAEHLESAGLDGDPRHLYALASIVRQAEDAAHAAHKKIAEIRPGYVVPPRHSESS